MLPSRSDRDHHQLMLISQKKMKIKLDKIKTTQEKRKEEKNWNGHQDRRRLRTEKNERVNEEIGKSNLRISD